MKQEPEKIENPEAKTAFKGLAQPHPQVFDIQITDDGSWYHEGGLIRRPALVKLFASVLQRADDGSFWLVTPVERGTITVADAPFIVVAMTVDGAGPGQVIRFWTNVEDEIVLSVANPLQMRAPLTGSLAMARDGGGDSGGDKIAVPYLIVRSGLEAKVSRPVYYELAALAVSGDDGVFGVWSSGAFFRLEA
jgi:hypothetical protein